MLAHLILFASLIPLGVLAFPAMGTQTLNRADKVARACAPLSRPTAPYFVVASRPNSPIHNLAMNAGPDHRIILGEEPDVPPCPFKDQSKCPPGAYTVFTGFGSLYVAVAGGQQVFAAPNGHLGFTAAHSAATPGGAKLDPFTYDKGDRCNSNHGTISTHAFQADGLMACPTKSDTTNSGNHWRVFVSSPNVRPPTGSRDDCIGFQALAFDYKDEGHYKAAAWEYD